MTNNSNIVSLENDTKNSAMVEVEASRAVQEVQASLVIAKRFPRDEEQALKKILKACSRPSLADSGLYTYARGGTDITGPSIRLAEAIAQYWGNLDFGWRELERTGNRSSLQAYAWDKETNTRSEMVFDVKHVRNTKKGTYALKDERDIYENNANQASRRVRACILRLTPGDVVETAVHQCELTIASQATPEKIEKLIKAFAGFGVNAAMIEARIQRKIDAIQGTQVVDLRRVYNSLKDGMSGVSQWFDTDLAEKPKVTKEKTKVDKFKEEQGDPEPAPDPKPEQGELTPPPPKSTAPKGPEDIFPGDIPEGVTREEYWEMHYGKGAKNGNATNE